MTQKKVKTIVLLPADVMEICRCTERTAQKKLQAVRRINKKEKHQYVTVDEFSKYSGITVKLIRQYFGEDDSDDGKDAQVDAVGRTDER